MKRSEQYRECLRLMEQGGGPFREGMKRLTDLLADDGPAVEDLYFSADGKTGVKGSRKGCLINRPRVEGGLPLVNVTFGKDAPITVTAAIRIDASPKLALEVGRAIACRIEALEQEAEKKERRERLAAIIKGAGSGEATEEDNTKEI